MVQTTGGEQRSLTEVKTLIKERADLVEIAGRYTKLTRAGHRFRGVCPFHKEKTPSFYVNPQENFFHCFGCGAGGDVFTFLEKADGLSFMEAMKELASSLHIDLPSNSRFSPDVSRENKEERAAGYDMLERAARFYHRVLMGEATPGARAALAYLRKRGISDDEINELLIGWAPEGGQDLLRKITSEADQKVSMDTGLVRQGDHGVYEFFQSRIMIPIRDVKGRVCAFSGRTMSEVTGRNPKYKNSVESDWFKKKELLYGLDRAHKFIREDDFVCLVEGYFDQWAFHRHGIPAVAVMGTALSEDHLRLLGRYTKRAVLVLDADRAGVESTLKAIPSFVRGGWNVMVFAGLEGKDPDEWLAQAGSNVENLKERLRGATEAVEWWVKLVLKECLAKGYNRLETFKRVSEPWKFATDPAHQQILADELGRMIGLGPSEVLESLRRLPAADGVQSSARVEAEAKILDTMPMGKMWTHTAVEEAFVWWIRHWETLTPQDQEGWRERAQLFSRTAAEKAVFDLGKKASQMGWQLGSFGPRDWLEVEELDARARSWIQKGLVLKDDPEEKSVEDKVLISFKEVSSILHRERVHSEISRLQSEIRGTPPGSPDMARLLQKVQDLRLSLEKSK